MRAGWEVERRQQLCSDGGELGRRRSAAGGGDEHRQQVNTSYTADPSKVCMLGLANCCKISVLLWYSGQQVTVMGGNCMTVVVSLTGRDVHDSLQPINIIFDNQTHVASTYRMQICWLRKGCGWRKVAHGWHPHTVCRYAGCASAVGGEK